MYKPASSCVNKTLKRFYLLVNELRLADQLLHKVDCIVKTRYQKILEEYSLDSVVSNNTKFYLRFRSKYKYFIVGLYEN